MTDRRAPRPTDLVALVTFNGEVRENLAVTRERLGQPGGTPRTLAAAVEQWLHLGRRTWVTLAGREIVGVATAREITRTTWEIDTLLDAGDGAGVVTDLLRQAVSSATRAEITHLLLRTPIRNGTSSDVVEDAIRTGFARVYLQRLWLGRLHGMEVPRDTVRPATEADEFGLFQLYARAIPAAARQSMAMTFEEWSAVRDRRWSERGGAMVMERDGRLVGVARYARHGGQLSLLTDPAHADAASTLLRALAPRLAAEEQHLALVPTCGAAEEQALRDAGFEAGAEFALLCRRIAPAVHVDAPATARVLVTG